MIIEYLENPITRLLLSRINEHKEAHLDALKGKILINDDITKVRDEISILKGQIFTLELLEDLQEFLEFQEEK